MLWTGVVVWLLSLLPSLVHVLPPNLTLTWADEFSDVPVLFIALVALAVCSHRAEEGGERAFWGLLAGCPAAWLLVRLLYSVIPYGDTGVLLDQVTDLSYLVGYLCVVLALEFRPRPTGRRTAPRPRVEWLATLLYAFFLLSYFTLAPSIFRPELYATWVPSMLLYSVIDAYLLARTWSLLRVGVDTAWTAPFRWLWAIFWLWLAGDLIEGLMYMEVIPFVDPGTPADTLWMAPSILFLVVARSCSWEPGRRERGR